MEDDPVWNHFYDLELRRAMSKGRRPLEEVETEAHALAYERYETAAADIIRRAVNERPHMRRVFKDLGRQAREELAWAMLAVATLDEIPKEARKILARVPELRRGYCRQMMVALWAVIMRGSKKC